MKKVIYLLVGLLILSITACASAGKSTVPEAAVSPITINGDLAKINVCQAIPQEDIEAVMGRKLVSAPKSFEYYDSTGTSGCWYDAGKDSNGAAYFGYVVLTPLEVYNNQPLYKNINVEGIGQSAYFNNGADARQLWVKVSDQVAFVVGFGDEPREEGVTSIARLFLAAIH